jgi:hypothetical protein
MTVIQQKDGVIAEYEQRPERAERDFKRQRDANNEICAAIGISILDIYYTMGGKLLGHRGIAHSVDPDLHKDRPRP